MMKLKHYFGERAKNALNLDYQTAFTRFVAKRSCMAAFGRF